MGSAAQNLRELLSLAAKLRRFAQDHAGDNNHDLFLSAAVALEGRAEFIAHANDMTQLEQDLTLHAPVDRLI